MYRSLVLGGRPGQRLRVPHAAPARDTLLRIIRRQSVRPGKGLQAIGIDDWAYKRGQCYGTIVTSHEYGCKTWKAEDHRTKALELTGL